MKKEKEARSESESIVKVDIEEAKVIEGSAEGKKEEEEEEEGGEEKGDGSMGVWNPADIQVKEDVRNGLINLLQAMLS